MKAQKNILVWLNPTTGNPVCTRELTEQIINTDSHRTFSSVFVASPDKRLLRLLPKSGTSALPKNLYIVLPRSIIKRMNSYVSKNDFEPIRDTLFWVASLINKEITEWNHFLNEDASKIQFGLRYNNADKKRLKAVLLEYENRYLKGVKESGDIKSISFEFSHKTKSYKINNWVVLDYILYALRKHLDVDEIPTINYSKELTKTYYGFSKSIFEFYSIEPKGSLKSKKEDLYRKISSLFELAGVEASGERVKKWIQRASVLGQDTP